MNMKILALSQFLTHYVFFLNIEKLMAILGSGVGVGIGVGRHSDF